VVSYKAGSSSATFGWRWSKIIYNLKLFRERVHELHRRAILDDGRKASQRDLAQAVGLHPTELSNRLNGSRGKQLSQRDVRAIVRTLAEWSAITTQGEALELLALLGCPPFTAAEWQTAALALLAGPEADQPAPRLTSNSNPPPKLGNLPAELSSFIGREHQLSELAELLTSNRLLTLSGVGGAGKSRLALAAAARVQSSLPVATYWVALAGLHDGKLVARAVALALGLTEQASTPLVKTIIDQVQGQRLLLVFDNCEHLVADVADLVHQLLTACPNLVVLATSRELLGTEGEVAYLVPPLTLPQPATSPPPSELVDYEAIRLFIERANTVADSFTLTAENANSVQAICQRLDGIPLAIELAAVRVQVMSVTEIESRLTDRFQLLTGGLRTALPHQQTLRAACVWSYDLLSKEEQRLFSELAVFPASFSLAAIIAIYSELDDQPYLLLNLLTALVSKSLVIKEMLGEQPHYRMLETIREYAQEHLVALGSDQEVRERHALYYLSLAETGAAGLLGAEQGYWLGQLEREHHNLRAALSWALAQGRSDLALKLGASLWRFWYMHSHYSEGRTFLTAALAAGSGNQVARCQALEGLGNMAYVQGDYDLAQQLLNEGLSLSYRLHDKANTARLLNSLGNIAYMHGEYPTAGEHYRLALQLSRELGNKRVIASTLSNLGNVAYNQVAYAEAEQCYRESLQVSRQAGDQLFIAYALSSLGNLLTIRHEYATAHSLYEEGLLLSRALEDEQGIAVALHNLGDAAAGQHDYAAAQTYLVESLALRRRVGDRWGIANLLIGLARVAAQQSSPGATKQAVQLLAASASLFNLLKATIEPVYGAERENTLATCRLLLDEATFAHAWREGETMPLEELLDRILVSARLPDAGQELPAPS